MPAGRTDRLTRDLTIAMGILSFVVLAAQAATLFEPNTWIFRDGRFYVNVNENLIERASLEDPFAHSWYNGELGWNRNMPASFSNIALGARGEYYHFRPYILPVLSTPIYWAFGLPGTLFFNVLCMALVAAALFRFTRAYASPELSALAVLAFLMATGLRLTVYNYSVDVLLLALFAGSLAAIVSGRGTWAGVLYATTLTIKPTAAIYVLPLILIFLERRDLRGLLRAVLGGAVVLLVAGGINTYMYGRPWWFGYNRMLTVVEGQQVVESVVDSFTTPFDEGWERMWEGHWGLSHHYRLHLLAFIAVPLMLFRRPLYAIALIISVTAAINTFARFNWEGDRFLYPTLAFMVPALAVGAGVLGRGFMEAVRRVGRQVARTTVVDRCAVAAAVLVVAAGLATLGTPATLEQRIPDDGLLLGARALLHEGTLDLAALGPGVPLDGERSVATLSRFGQLLPRVPLPAVVLATPFVALAGKLGLLLLNLFAAALGAWAATRVVARVVPAPLAAAAALGATLLPPLATTVVGGGPALFAAAAAWLACHLALERRWASAAALAVLAAWLSDAPWLVGGAVVLLSVGVGGARRALFSGGGVLALWGLGHLLLIGRPFASPEDFVAVRLSGEVLAVRVPGMGAWELLSAAVEDAGDARAILPLLIVGPLGALIALGRDGRVGLLLLSLLASLPFAAVETGHLRWSPLALWSLGVCAAPLVWVVATRIGRSGWWWRHTPRRVVGLAAVALACLLVVGAVRATLVGARPFRLESAQSVRAATVHLDDIPCDFLAWENMAWECTQFDGGRVGRTGLAFPEGITVQGSGVDMLHVPDGLHGQRARWVRWEDLTIEGDTLRLTYAPVDGFHRGASVNVMVDGVIVDRFEVEAPRILERTIDVANWSGQEATLALQVRTLEPGRQTAVAFAGGFE